MRMFWIVCCLAASAAGHMAISRADEPLFADASETYRPSVVPDRIILTVTSEPATSQAVTWRTDTSVHKGLAEYAVAEAGPQFVTSTQQLVAETQRLESDLSHAHYHTAIFRGLKPHTKYVYRVGDGLNWSEWAHFTTAADQPAPFSFIYFGDAQTEIKSHWSRVVREAFADAPRASILLHAGDLINRANRDEQWGEWHNAGGWINGTIPTLATPGNHEYFAGEDQERSLSKHWRPQFELPTNGPPGLEETAYYIDYQGVRIVSLNSNVQHQEQAAWLDRLLADNPCQWTIVTMHHPIYSSAVGRDNPDLRAAWQPVFDKHRVDLVLQGHDHSYARSRLMVGEPAAAGETEVSPRRSDAGTVYVVSVSGPKMYDVGWQTYMRRAGEGMQLYQIISIDGAELKYEARTATGDLYDAFRLRQQPGQPNQLLDEVPQ